MQCRTWCRHAILWCHGCHHCATHAAQCCGHSRSRRTTFGVMGAVIVPRLVLWLPSSCHICVVVSIITQHVVSQALLSCCIWCCSCCHHTTYGVMVVVGVIKPHGVTVVFIAWSRWVLSCYAVLQLQLLHCMVSQSWLLHHVVLLNCEDHSDWTTKDEVSRKKEKRKKK